MNANEKYTKSEHLFRQRRNLLIISIILLFVKFFNVKASSLSILGASFNVESTDIIVFKGVLIFWLYFLIRYLQYFAENRPVIIAQFNGAFSQVFFEIFKKIKVHCTYIYDTRNLSLFNCSLDISSSDKMIYNKYIKKYNINMKKENGSEPLYTGTMSGWKVWLYIKILHRIIVYYKTPIWTNYYLPLFLSGMTLIYCFSEICTSTAWWINKLTFDFFPWLL